MFFALAQPQVPHQLREVLKCRIVRVPATMDTITIMINTIYIHIKIERDMKCQTYSATLEMLKTISECWTIRVWSIGGANRMHIREFSPISDWRKGRKEENWAILVFRKTVFRPISVQGKQKMLKLWHFGHWTRKFCYVPGWGDLSHLVFGPI